MPDPIALSHDQTAFFQANGYVGPFDLDAPELVAAARKLIDEECVEKTSPVYGVVSRRDWHLVARPIYDLCSQPAIVERLASLLGPDILLWRTQMFYKKPGDGETLWHQDYNFPGPFRVPSIDPPVTITAWIALDDATIENGCVELIAGSHLEGRLETVKDAGTEGIFGRNYRLARPIGGDDVMAKMTIKAGQFFLFSNLTVHGSGPNNSELTRLGIGARFTSTDVRVYPGVSIDGQGMSLDNYGCVLVRGENRFEHNRMRVPPELSSRIGEMPAGMKQTSGRETGFKTGYRLGYGKGERHAEKGIRIAIEDREEFSRGLVGYSKGSGDQLEYAAGFKDGLSAGYEDALARRPFDTQYGTPGDMGGIRGGRRRGPIFRVLRALKRLTKKF
ncbi:MAG: phytanoyl-CoA dioxygenase family protein [Blastocatellia bacterium]|nr:phytanoyl-CoA dioxygenase family protein [Blastocatellia bacterium]